MSVDETNWYRLLPDDLYHKAYRSENDELAWPKEQALRVLDILSQNRFVVVGIDIWIPTTPGPTIPTPFVYDWLLERMADANTHNASAREFVSTFKWDPSDESNLGMTPVFNIWAEPHSS